MNGDSTSSYLGACRKDIPYPSVSNESVPSLIDNLVTALYGTIKKTVVNRRVIWEVPCDPDNTATFFNVPRNSGEGLLCYFIRVFNPANGYTLNGKYSGTFQGNLIGGATGSVVYQSATNVTSFLEIGAEGEVLTVGPNGTLDWTTGVSVNRANNLTGGVAGAVPYQTSPSNTGFTAAGSANQVLHSNGTGAPTWSSVVPADLSTGHPTWDTSNNVTDINNITIAGNATISGDANISGNVTGNAATTINTQSIVNAIIFGG
jgi:hypothetical protein